MRSLVVGSGSTALALGGVAVFVVAPLAVAADLRDAYARLAASPNLAAALVFGSAWLLVGIAATALAGRLRASRATTVGVAMLVAGLVGSGLWLPYATMSNAIADAGAVAWVTAELPAWLVCWAGMTLLVVGAAVVALATALAARARTA